MTRISAVKTLLMWLAALATLRAHAALPDLKPGDVVIGTYSGCCCTFPEPGLTQNTLSILPQGSTASAFNVSWPRLTHVGAVAHSDHAGLIVAAYAYPQSDLLVLSSSGTLSSFGSAPFVTDGAVGVLAPTATDTMALVMVSVSKDVSQQHAELWRIAPNGTVVSQFPLPITGPSQFSLDVAADQCTVFYTTGTAIARFDACRQVSLSDFAQTGMGLGHLRIAPDGEVLAIGSHDNLLWRFSPDGQAMGIFELPLIFDSLRGIEEVVTAFAFDETAESIWVGTTFLCAGGGEVLRVDRMTGRILSGPSWSPAGGVFAIGTVNEWRAAQPHATSRRRAVTH